MSASPAPAGGTGLKELIRREAVRLGFDLVGFARADRTEPEGPRLSEWLSKRYNASMAWMERTEGKRRDPALVLPGVRTIVSLGVNYYTPHGHSNEPGTGKISRYAWGDDYHHPIAAGLDKLLEKVTSADPSVSGKVYSDTGPVLEKAWAQRAGLGWQGKHTNLISREFGSWLFLGEILLTADIEPDLPETDQCGQCTLCIEACPTQAIVEPYVLDAGRCISYLTIEHRGEIDLSLAEDFEGWLYGCDVCQDVCPWNARPVPSTWEDFLPRPGNVDRDLEGVLAMNASEFSETFRKSPVKRAGHAGLRRNARILTDKS